MLRPPYREKIVAAADEASRTLGALLYAASRLLLLYITHHIEANIPFPATGLANENKAWVASGEVGEAPVIVTQELCEWAICLFFKKRKQSPSRENHPAFVALRTFSEDPGTLGTFPRQDSSNLRYATQAAAKSLSVVVKNHLNVACLRHLAKSLRAKYHSLILSKKEAQALAQFVGKSVQWNAERDRLMGTRGPYSALPTPRSASRKKIQGVWTDVPAVESAQWEEIARHERDLLPFSWDQGDMLRSRYAMLFEISKYNTDHLGTSELPSFSLLPLCSAGRCFLKLNTVGLQQLCERSGVHTHKEDVLGIFDPKKLRSILRARGVDGPPKLTLCGEFFRTDGVQAQFVCGFLSTKARRVDGGGGPDADVVDEENMNVEEDDIQDDCIPCVPAEDQKAVDPGRSCLITLVGVRNGKAVDAGEEEPEFVREYRLTRGHYYEMRGTTKTKNSAKMRLARSPEYKAAMESSSRNSLCVSDHLTLCVRTKVQSDCWAAIHTHSGSRSVARARFDRSMRRGTADAEVARKVLGPEVRSARRVIAWGGARWAHAAKGTAPCPASALFRMLSEKIKGTSSFLVRERETNTSCKCSACLSPEKMVHPIHPTRKIRINGARVVDGGEVFGLYQCTHSGCHRTHDRDVNGASNIWRAYFERSRGRARPLALMGRSELERWSESVLRGGNEVQPCDSA